MSKQAALPSRGRALSESTTLLILCVPAILLYFLFFVVPIFGNVILSFTNWDGSALRMGRMRFIGLDNYAELFTRDRLFYAALRHNLAYTIAVVFLQNTLALGFALVLTRRSPLTTFLKTVFLLPVVLSTLTLSLIWSYVYDPMFGMLNELLRQIGLDSLTRAWLGDESIALLAVAFVNVWQWAGYSMVIYIAGLNAIPRDIYEAADVAGASPLRVFRSITLPLLLPAVTINVVLSTLGCMKVFGLVYVMTGGGPNESTEVLATLIFRTAFDFGRMGYAASISMILLLIIMIIGFTQTVVLRRLETQL